MTKASVVLQVPAKQAGEILPSTLAVGPAAIEITSERTANGGSHSRRFAARWSHGSARANAMIDVEPASKTSSRIAVTIEPPQGVARVAWIAARRRSLGKLFAQALGYEIETRSIEEADAFEVRRTTADLVRARTA